MVSIFGAILVAVLFWFLKEVVAVVIVYAFIGLGILVSRGKDVVIVIFGIVGILAAIGWTIFAIASTFMQIVGIVQMIGG